MIFLKPQTLFNTKSFTPQNYDSSLKEISSYNNGAVKVFSWNSLGVIVLNIAEQYNQNPIVRSIIDKISTAVSSLEPIVFDLETRKKDNDHPLNYLLKRPNREQTWREHVRDLISDLFVYGVYYDYALLRNKDILSVRRIVPTRVITSAEDIEGNTMSYNIRIGDVIKNIENYPYDNPRSSILKQTFYNPFSSDFKDNGETPLISASDAINHLNIANKFNTSYIKNGARPSIAIIVKPQDGFDGNLTPEQREILKNELNEHYSGSENAGRPILLEGGLEIQNLTSTLKDMDFSNLIDLSAQMICISAGVPCEVIGLIKSKTYNSADEARKAFMINTVLPIADWFYEKQNIFLMSKYDDAGRYKLTYNRSGINILMKDVLDIMIKAKETEAYTTNEVRNINNLDAVEGGDEVRIGMSTAPLGSTSKNFNTNNGNTEND